VNIYILRHAIAVPRGTPGYPNDDRPLTLEGIEKMKAAAEGLSKNISSVDLIMSSPLKRALSTATIAARSLHCRRKVQITKLLLPEADPQSLVEEISTLKNEEHVMFVGHNPHLELFASLLLGEQKTVVEFKKGGICCIEIDEVPVRAPGRLMWLMTPKQLRHMSL
jgi:phosphohistidine phosphatase